MTARSPLIAGAIGFSIGCLVSLVIFFICLIAFFGCAGQRLPTPAENKDYCEGQLLLCVNSKCDAIAGSAPGDPCRKACQDDYDACMRCPTQTR